MNAKQYREVKLADRFPSEFGRYNFKAKGQNIFVGDNYMKCAEKQEYLDRYESWLEEYDSKAPEMLEMLERIHKIENDAFKLKAFDVNRLKSELEQLIKKVTKI